MASSSRTSTRRYLKGELTREQILLAAKRLFTTNGYHNTSIYDLFDQAGITKGAFYHHWKTKEDLALTILEEMKDNYERRLFPILQQDEKGRDLIEQTLRTVEELNKRSDWYYCKLMAVWCSELQAGEEGLGKAVHEVHQRWLEFWNLLVKRAQEQGGLRNDIPSNELSALIVSSICGVYLISRNDGGVQHYPIETLRKLLLT